jgi:hypothetical protein
MKKLHLVTVTVLALFLLTACGNAPETAPADNGTPPAAESTDTPVVEETTGPVPFAEVGDDIMDAKANYKLFRFLEGEGTCMEMGFPTNLVYAAPNMIKTEDESYVEDMTMVDFTGRISFNELPLSTGNVACEAKTNTGVTTVKVTCSSGEGDEKKEVCTASFKLYAEK